jgi:glycosyltransferase involved in cell wall biosynthesis
LTEPDVVIGAAQSASGEPTPAVPESFELTILLPCLNEAETLAACIEMGLSFLATSGVSGEVLVADNGSTDGSQDIALAAGARTISVSTRGYGAAILGGIAAARSRYVVMGDADLSYDLAHLMPFLLELRGGADLVMGNRFKGGIAEGAMPFSHRYVGNPVLSRLGRIFFRIKISDFHCGLRGFDRQRIVDLHLRTTGMELASEMIVKSALAGYRITEVPTTLARDGRSRPPHLRTWHDGWRHLRFLFIYSPRWLFLYPGLALIALGLAGVAVLLPGQVRIGAIRLDIHTFVAACMAVLIGLQSVTFAIVARRYATLRGLLPASRRYVRVLRVLSPDKFLAGGAALFLLSFGGLLWCVGQWAGTDFGSISDPRILRVLLLSFTGAAAGVQLVLLAFLSSLIEVPQRDDQASD